MPRRLPPFPLLYNLYADKGMTTRQIAVKYGVRAKSVQGRLREESARHGRPWPVRTSAHEVTVTTLGVREEIIEVMQQTGVLQKEIARLAEVSLATACDIVTGRQARVTWATASRIEEACRMVREGEVEFRVRKGWGKEKKTPLLPPGERTHCPQRHPYTERNTYLKRRGDGSVIRECRVCLAAARRRYRARVAEGLVGVRVEEVAA